MSPCRSESMCITEWAKPVMVQRIAPQHSCSTSELPNQANRHERNGFPALRCHVLPQENTSCNIRSREHCCWKLLRGIQTRFVSQDRHFCWVRHPDLECSAHLPAARVCPSLTCCWASVGSGICPLLNLKLRARGGAWRGAGLPWRDGWKT